jgi:8-oxo-dGTP pyrophosphatase MutT (NUDIX family)
MRTVSSREVYRNPWISVREDEVEHPDGTPGLYGVLDRPDFALVVPQERGGFWLVEQYRYPVQRRGWEFPQGTWGAGRSGTRDETGLTAGRTTHLGHLYLAYGISSQGYDVHLAEDLVPGEPDRDATEQDMQHAFFTEDAFIAMVARGDVVDGCTLAAYSLLLLHRR